MKEKCATRLSVKSKWISSIFFFFFFVLIYLKAHQADYNYFSSRYKTFLRDTLTLLISTIIDGSPFEKQHIASIESIQRAAAWFVCSDYSSYSSVTGITHSLGWDSLEKHRNVDSVTMMYKVVNNLVHIPPPNSVQISYSRTRANHPYKFMHIFANSNAYKHSFFPRVIPSGTACLVMPFVQNQLGLSKLS